MLVELSGGPWSCRDSFCGRERIEMANMPQPLLADVSSKKVLALEANAGCEANQHAWTAVFELASRLRWSGRQRCGMYWPPVDGSARSIDFGLAVRASFFSPFDLHHDSVLHNRGHVAKLQIAQSIHQHLESPVVHFARHRSFSTIDLGHFVLQSICNAGDCPRLDGRTPAVPG